MKHETEPTEFDPEALSQQQVWQEIKLELLSVCWIALGLAFLSCGLVAWGLFRETPFEVHVPVHLTGTPAWIVLGIPTFFWNISTILLWVWWFRNRRNPVPNFDTRPTRTRRRD
ncbi:MAG: hypothetical protein ACRC8S_07260 [Fimbriiglobus sp.]